MSNTTPPREIITSRMPANNSYGRNGFQGASSDLPGQNTTSGVLPRVIVPNDETQVRKISAEPIAPAHGMRDRNATPTKITSKNSRR